MTGNLRSVAFGRSIPGGRSSNQDDFLILDETHEVVRRRCVGSLFAVADGMGGHLGGKTAARIAMDSLVEYFDTVRAVETTTPLDSLETLFLRANERILEQSRSNPALQGMGTTMTVALLDHDLLHFAHAGDSRLYRVRRGSMKLVTEDENFAFQMVLEGTLSETEYQESPFRDSLFNYLGKERLRVQKGTLDLRLGDTLLLMTDGFVKTLSASEIVGGIARMRSADLLVDDLMGRAEERRPNDNATLLAIVIERALERHV